MINKENLGYADGANRMSSPRYQQDKEYMKGYDEGYLSTESGDLEDDYLVKFPDGSGGTNEGMQLKLGIEDEQ